MPADAASSAPALVPVSPDTQEVRFATTMTGGVSLAIWMGGVTRELDLLLQASCWRESYEDDPPAPPDQDKEAKATYDAVARYRKLIDFMDVVVDTDVVSGTSAGGINGVLLAVARVRGLDLGELRDVWLDVAGLETLLRDPGDRSIPSLLYGDEQMLAKVDEWLGKLPPASLPGRQAPKEGLPTRLYVTATLLTGESGYFTDSFGTFVHDTDQHGVFRFDAEQLAKPENDGALALAARSTASFPGAFEPSFLPYDRDVPAAGKVPARPAMGRFTNITRNHWVADGGILNNQPINLVVRDIFRRPAFGPVRRVLLYVVPSTGPAPDAVAKAPEDSVAAPYGLVEALLKDLSARMHASITEDLLAIREHNDRVDARADLRLWVAAKHADSVDRLLTPGVLLAYGGQVAQTVGRDVARSMLKLLSSWSPPQEDDAGLATVPEPWAGKLKGGGVDRVIEQTVGATLGRRFRSRSNRLPDSADQFASYGQAAFDTALSIVLDVLRAAETLAPTVDDRLAVAVLVKQAHQAANSPRVTPLDRLVFQVCGDVNLRQQPIEAAAAKIATDYAAQRAVPPDAWRRDGAGGDAGPPGLADVLQRVGALPFVDDAALAAVEPNNVLAEAVLRYRCLSGYLHLTDDTETIARRLFDLAVTERSLRPVDAGPQQRINLVQVSADTSTLLSDRATALTKLTGMQLYHFGAFYKRSWRANDWMWGRLDGAGWLVHVLLDPARARHVAGTRAPKGVKRSRWFLDQLATLFGFEIPSPPGADVESELGRFLDDDEAALPASLPKTSLWLAQAWQLQVARDELPVLAEMILAPNADSSPRKSVAWANKVTVPNPDYASLLRECPVPDETFKTDFGTPLLTRTVAKAVATAGGAIEQVREIPAGVRAPIKTARTVTLAGYRVVRWTGGVAKWVIALGLTVFVASLAIQSAAVSVFGGWPLLGALVGGYMVVFGVWQWSYRVLGALVAMTITVGLAALGMPYVRGHLFGKKVGEGWVAHRIPWLGSAWWHPLVALAVVILAMTVYAALLTAMPRHVVQKREKERKPAVRS